MEPIEVDIPVGEEAVSGLWLRPADARALYLFAHGAGVSTTSASVIARDERLRGVAANGVAFGDASPRYRTTTSSPV